MERLVDETARLLGYVKDLVLGPKDLEATNNCRETVGTGGCIVSIEKELSIIEGYSEPLIIMIEYLVVNGSTGNPKCKVEVELFAETYAGSRITLNKLSVDGCIALV